MSTINTDLKTLLQRLGRSQADLCRAADLDYTRLSGWINGLWRLPQPQLDRIAEVMEAWQAEEVAKLRQGGPA